MHFGGQGQRTDIGRTETETKTETETGTGTGTKTKKCYRTYILVERDRGHS